MRRNRYLSLFTSFGLVCGVAALTARDLFPPQNGDTLTKVDAVSRFVLL